VAARVLFLTSGGITRPSSRFRVYQYLPYFEQSGEIEIVDVVEVNRSLSLFSMAQTLLSIPNKVRRTDTLFIQKVRLPIPLLQSLASRCKIIYDIDDAIFVPRSATAGRDFGKKLDRLNESLTRADRIVAGNKYLADYASHYSSNVVVIPTVVDTGQEALDAGYFSRWQFSRQIFQPPHREKPSSVTPAPVVIGWIGMPWHIQWLDAVGPVLRWLQQKYGVTIKVVSSREWNFPGLQVINREWRLEDEVADLQTFDIGLMPLDANVPRLRGKCGFKIIEYMATGSPPVASSVGVNTEIIEHGVNGFLVSDSSEWGLYLEMLVKDPDLRYRMGDVARRRIVESYSVSSVLPRYMSLFAGLTR
jgi:glycosyltransferase involved in cell wall biosynthesis